MPKPWRLTRDALIELGTAAIGKRGISHGQEFNDDCYYAVYDAVKAGANEAQRKLARYILEEISKIKLDGRLIVVQLDFKFLSIKNIMIDVLEEEQVSRENERR